jgi:hypothetical protein
MLVTPIAGLEALRDSDAKEITSFSGSLPKVSIEIGGGPATISLGSLFTLTLEIDLDLYLGYMFPIFYQFNVYD